MGSWLIFLSLSLSNKIFILELKGNRDGDLYSKPKPFTSIIPLIFISSIFFAPIGFIVTKIITIKTRKTAMLLIHGRNNSD